MDKPKSLIICNSRFGRICRYNCSFRNCRVLQRAGNALPERHHRILTEKGIGLTFTVAGVTEIKKWLYSWMPHVEIVRPEWFRAQVRKELSETAKKHAK